MPTSVVAPLNRVSPRGGRAKHVGVDEHRALVVIVEDQPNQLDERTKSRAMICSMIGPVATTR